MKRIFYLISLAFCFSLFISCQQAPLLSVSGPRSYTFTRDGGTQSFSFTCNRDWSISTTEDWISVSPSSGTVSEEAVAVTIKCNPNSTYDPRTATLTVMAEDLAETITVNQETGIGLIVSPKTWELTNAKQVIEIEVQKNVQYSIAIDDESSQWIKQGGTKALTTDNVTFTIEENTSYDNREGKIVFKQLDGNLTESVTVRQSQTNGLFITTPTYKLSREAHSLSVEVKANVEFEVTSQADWITHVETKALKTSTIVLSIPSNDTYENRTGTVLVKQTNGNLTGVIVINQAGLVAVNSVELNKTQLELEIGDYVQLIATIIPDDATDQVVIWSSSDSLIASIDNNGNVKAIKTGKATIQAKVGDIVASCFVSVRPKDSVDLGLSVFWAKSNLCSNGFETAPEKYGDYYSWGETEPKEVYWWENYKWCDGSMNSLTKYNTDSSKGVVDNIIVLEDADDAAHVILGGDWRMPTEEEMRELVNNCNCKWTTLNGVNGELFTSNINGNTLFLPASGGYGANVGVLGTYWDSSLYTKFPENGGAMGFASDGAIGVGGSRRNEGLTIRAVIKE